MKKLSSQLIIFNERLTEFLDRPKPISGEMPLEYIKHSREESREDAFKRTFASQLTTFHETQKLQHNKQRSIFGGSEIQAN